MATAPARSWLAHRPSETDPSCDDAPATHRRRKQTLTVHDAMTWPAPFAQAVMPVRSARRLLAREAVHELPVLSWGECIGVVCACDLEAVPDEALVFEHMRSPVRRVPPQCALAEAARLMDHYGVDLLVCSWNDRFGFVTRDDLASLGLPVPRCASCGNLRHLRSARGDMTRFCRSCVGEAPSEVELAYYRDLGGSG